MNLPLILICVFLLSFLSLISCNTFDFGVRTEFKEIDPKCEIYTFLNSHNESLLNEVYPLFFHLNPIDLYEKICTHLNSIEIGLLDTYLRLRESVPKCQFYKNEFTKKDLKTNVVYEGFVYIDFKKFIANSKNSYTIIPVGDIDYNDDFVYYPSYSVELFRKGNDYKADDSIELKPLTNAPKWSAGEFFEEENNNGELADPSVENHFKVLADYSCLLEKLDDKVVIDAINNPLLNLKRSNNQCTGKYRLDRIDTIKQFYNFGTFVQVGSKRIDSRAFSPSKLYNHLNSRLKLLNELNKYLNVSNLDFKTFKFQSKGMYVDFDRDSIIWLNDAKAIKGLSSNLNELKIQPTNQRPIHYVNENYLNVVLIIKDESDILPALFELSNQYAQYRVPIRLGVMFSGVNKLGEALLKMDLETISTVLKVSFNQWEANNKFRPGSKDYFRSRAKAFALKNIQHNIMDGNVEGMKERMLETSRDIFEEIDPNKPVLLVNDRIISFDGAITIDNLGTEIWYAVRSEVNRLSKLLGPMPKFTEENRPTDFYQYIRSVDGEHRVKNPSLSIIGNELNIEIELPNNMVCHDSKSFDRAFVFLADMSDTKNQETFGILQRIFAKHNISTVVGSTKAHKSYPHVLIGVTQPILCVASSCFILPSEITQKSVEYFIQINQQPLLFWKQLSSLPANKKVFVLNRIPSLISPNYGDFPKGLTRYLSKENYIFEITGVIDPFSKMGVHILNVLSFFKNSLPIRVRIGLSFGEDITFAMYGYAEPASVASILSSNSKSLIHISSVPTNVLFTLNLAIPNSLMVHSTYESFDLDNIYFSKDTTRIIGEYSIHSITIQGHVFEKNGQGFGKPVAFNLLSSSLKHDSTLSMQKFGYFQLKGDFGINKLIIDTEGQKKLMDDEREILNIVHLSEEETIMYGLMNLDEIHSLFQQNPNERIINEIFMDSWDGSIVAVNVNRKPSSFLNKFFKKSDDKHDNTIHVFSLASGHLYERFIRAMVISVKNNTERPTHFYFLDNYASAEFRILIDHLSKKVGFEYTMLSYQWPLFVNPQREKHRIMWAYKILFLDVLFPMSVDRAIFVDADQTMRSDLGSLMDLNLNDKVYGFTPFCSSKKEMTTYRFWESKSGYWYRHLQGKPYHISALFVTDLKLFRKRGTGDQLRAIYENLSKDKNSLSNLDQDLPNYAQHQIPIFSLPQEWLWCQTWCSDEQKAAAKVIDLCNNPKTKLHKLQQAYSFVPEWASYDEYARTLEAELRNKLNDDSASKKLIHDEL
eukprot:TRINITY_DN926_c0_g1_i1.p1 TRINITY_DN926_c0_g1~~TRINITY_DN926_c0_g1_i1.p1  ORF type:complete len:1281 (+),score=346.06 TRINITY_DN926_c0_g1_i1:37-3843(+)